jgi:hypothetical protein
MNKENKNSYWWSVWGERKEKKPLADPISPSITTG